MVYYYFEQGLRENQLCAWIVPSWLGVEAAEAALSKKLTDLHKYIEKKQFELLSHLDTYLKFGTFDPDYMLSLFIAKEQDVLKNGYSGFCLSGDSSWLKEEDWDKLADYERDAHMLIRQKEITALCTYPSDRFDNADLFNLSFSHDLVLRKKDGKMDILIDKREFFR
jgi:hypothetical protein